MPLIILLKIDQMLYSAIPFAIVIFGRFVPFLHAKSVYRYTLLIHVLAEPLILSSTNENLQLVDCSTNTIMLNNLQQLVLHKS